MNNLEIFKKKHFKDENERNKILTTLVRDCIYFNQCEGELLNIETEIGIFCSKHCNKCYSANINKVFNWNTFCTINNFKCGEDCLLSKISESNDEDDAKKISNNFEKLKMSWFDQKKKVNKCYKLYENAFIQQKDFVINIKKQKSRLKKTKALLVLKKQYLNLIINLIQLSIIIVSSSITFFESTKDNLGIDKIASKIISIAASTYIAFILAISRFFKFDSSNENLGKVIERYSFIINRVEQMQKNINNFNLKTKTIDEWNNQIENLKNESIEDIIVKTNEEKDNLLTLKESVYYQKIYIRLKLKKEINRSNFNKALEIADNLKDLKQLKKLKSIKQFRCCSFNIFKCCTYHLDFDSIYDDDNKNNNDNNDDISDNNNIQNNILNIKNNLHKLKNNINNLNSSIELEVKND